MHLINTTFVGVTTRPASDEVRGRGRTCCCGVCACGDVYPLCLWSDETLHAVGSRKAARSVRPPDACGLICCCLLASRLSVHLDWTGAIHSLQFVGRCLFVLCCIPYS